jgi:hypothetical protein
VTCDFVAYEPKDKEAMNQVATVSSPFTTGTILLTRTHRLLVPTGLNGAVPVNPVLQKTKDSLDPPNVFLTTQDLGQFPDMRVDPIDEVCVQRKSSNDLATLPEHPLGGRCPVGDGRRAASATTMRAPGRGGHFFAPCV